jgi:hypothetical protein
LARKGRNGVRYFMWKIKKADAAKLRGMTGEMLAGFGFVKTAGHDAAAYQVEVWRLESTRFGCPLEVGLHISHDGFMTSPSLCCRFQRDYDPAFKWNEGPNEGGIYRDIREYMGGGVNQFTGKYNCHLWDKISLEVALGWFRVHIEAALPDLVEAD